jgi:hypothetical protein
MTKSQLKDIVSQLEALGVADSVDIQVMRSADNSLIELNGTSFKVVGQASTYTIDAGGHFAGVVSQISAVILLQP